MFSQITKISALLLLGSNVFCTTKSQESYPFIQTIQYRANNPIQDRVVYSKLSALPAYTFSVFDGHGGDLVAQYASKNICQFLNNRLVKNLKLKLPQKQLCEISLSETYDDIEISFFSIFKSKIQEIQYRTVGACALTAIVLKNAIYVANAGDCEGILIRNKDYEKTNRRLNAGEPEQQQRLRSQFPNENDIIKCKKNTNYCYVKGRLQPTRSLADFYLKFPQYNFTKLPVFTGPYITHRPVLTNFKNNSDCKYLILGSDGLWDELSDEMIFNESKKDTIGKKMSENILNLALKKACQRNYISRQKLDLINNRRDLHDDISIILVNLSELNSTLR